MRAIDQHFELWAQEVERLIGRSVDRKRARDAFECYEPPTKALTPEEYAYELQRSQAAALLSEGGGWSPPSPREVDAMQRAAYIAAKRRGALAQMPDDGFATMWGDAEMPTRATGGGLNHPAKSWWDEPTRASREAPRIWKRDAPIQRIINWIWWLTGTRP